MGGKNLFGLVRPEESGEVKIQLGPLHKGLKAGMGVATVNRFNFLRHSERRQSYESAHYHQFTVEKGKD